MACSGCFDSQSAEGPGQDGMKVVHNAPMVRPRGVRSALLLALIALSACSSSKPHAGNVVPTTAAPTTTTDPYAVPATIDVAYVQRVMDAIATLSLD